MRTLVGALIIALITYMLGNLNIVACMCVLCMLTHTSLVPIFQVT